MLRPYYKKFEAWKYIYYKYFPAHWRLSCSLLHNSHLYIADDKKVQNSLHGEYGYHHFQYHIHNQMITELIPGSELSILTFFLYPLPNKFFRNKCKVGKSSIGAFHNRVSLTWIYHTFYDRSVILLQLY